MKTNLSVKTPLLILMISSAMLTACSSPRNSGADLEESETTDNSVLNNNPQILIVDNNESLPENMVTGNRVIEADAQNQAANSPNLNRAESLIAEAGSVRMAQPQAMVISPEFIPSNADYYSSYQYAGDQNRENYAEFEDNGITRVVRNPVSTFSIDVDTGSYSNVRRIINTGNLPPADAVRTEELINYFSYDYPQTNTQSAPFSLYTEISVSPWNQGKHLLHIGLKAVDLDNEAQKPANLVFLVDVSGSMQDANKLDLLKTSLQMLSRQMDADDTVSIVVYAGATGIVLEPTAGNETRKISAALERLGAGGGTNGAAGIQLAYALAEDAFIEDGINRVILATDGDFNVGMVNFDELKKLISKKRESGISLTTLGFGSGNYNDQLMEQLADAGNGNYAYIDTINEARKVLVDELASTLQTVAKDVKIQIEFNPSVISEYRLIGYENRALLREDFNNDNVDAGDIGVGHTVTALYEVSMVGSDNQSVEPLRYPGNQQAQIQTFAPESELAFLKLRYKEPEGDASELLEQSILVDDIIEDLDNTSENYRFAAAVAGLTQLLRSNNQLNDFDYDEVIGLANSARGEDEFGYRSEFINLVRTAQSLSFH